MKLNGLKVAIFILTTVGMALVCGGTSTTTTTIGPEAQSVTPSSDTTVSALTELEHTTKQTDTTTTATVTSPPTIHLSLSAQREECFQAANLTQVLTNITCDIGLLVHYSVIDFWMHHATPHMCQRRAAYGEAIGCVLGATKSCLPQRNRVHFPDTTKTREGLSYICDVSALQQFDVNMTCAQQHLSKVFDCVHKDTLSVLGQDSLPSQVHSSLVCRTYDIADLCTWEELQACGEDTAAAYTRLMSQYLRPPSCSAAAMTVAVSTLTLVVCFLTSLKM